MLSSSRISRIKQASSVSPDSILPPGNSQVNGKDMLALRCTAKMPRGDWMIPQTTFMGLFIGQR